MKFRYKLLIVLAVFIISLVIFGGGIRETLFQTSASVTTMSDATLPTVSIDVNGNEINRLHGYVANLDEMIMRETITPITGERTFTVLIEENESTVKKLKYEIFNSDGREVESDSFTVLDVEDGPKKVRIALKETMKSGKEYIAKFTLITNQSKRIYYYTRLKMYDDGHLYEKLDFATSFRDTLLNGSAAEKEKLKKYLESSKASDNSTYAYVNIKSSYSMVTWGELEPQLLWEELPTIVEFYDSMATIELKYIVSIEVETGIEYYVVKEHFRFNYTASRTYLYSYERLMDAIFDVQNTSLSKDEFKLGITGETDADTGASPSKKYLSFVYGRELMLYDVDANELIKVFSFRQNNNDYSRDYYDQHNVKLLYVHDNGDVDFLVSGYMNRGEYEGRVGIVLYRFVKADLRIEEQLYIPINSSYQMLAADMTDFAYLGERDVFYFALYDSIYSYDLTTHRMNVIASGVPAENMVWCETENYLAWQDNADDLLSKNIFILNLADGEIHSITTSEGETVRIYGMINDNIVYGFAHDEDIWTLPDGSRRLPAYKLCIEDGYGNVLKTYIESGMYIDDISIGDNMLVLKRFARKAGAAVAYVEAPEDTILNRLETVTKPVSLTKRVTDKILTEYYVSLPQSVSIEETPKLSIALSTIINYDTTTRVSMPEDRESLYYAYSFGEIIKTDTSAAAAVIAADEGIGTVIDSLGRVVWERGIKAARTEISGIKQVPVDETHDSRKAAMKMLLAYRNFEIDTDTYDLSSGSMYEWLSSAMKTGVLNLTGASLDEVLYYVYKSRPVIAVMPDGNAGVLTAYDALSVTVWEPAKKKSTKYQLKEAVSMFGEAGNIFISYTE